MVLEESEPNGEWLCFFWYEVRPTNTAKVGWLCPSTDNTGWTQLFLEVVSEWFRQGDMVQGTMSLMEGEDADVEDAKSGIEGQRKALRAVGPKWKAPADHSDWAYQGQWHSTE